jgi:site-specific recombinase XerD
MVLYNLRHTFATRSILSGIDVTILQKILGTR